MKNPLKLSAVQALSCLPIHLPQKPENHIHRAEKAILESSSISSSDSDPKTSHEAATSSKSPNAPVAAGMECVVKNLYPDKRGQWTDKYPTFIRDAPENDQTARAALIVRHKAINDSRKKLEIESIVIQSPILKRALGKVFSDYPGITTGLDRLEFAAPFQPFVHRWSLFEQATVDEIDAQTRLHLALLWHVLETEMRAFLQKLKDYTRHGVIDYESIWSIFEPNSLVVMSRNGGERIYRCVNGSYDENQGMYKIEGQYIDWDGDKFGFASTSIPIPSFNGTVPIMNLSIVPLGRCPDAAAIEARVLERAKTFESLRDYHFKAYDGLGIDATGFKCARFNVQGRVIIDTAAFNLFNPNDQVKTSSLDTKKPTPTNNSTDPPPPPPLSKLNLLITPDTVRGYSLSDKKWLTLFITCLHPISYSTTAFLSLVLPAATKDLIHAFAASQLKQSHEFDDVIQGKGRGTIMLLSGPPGVGKTLTAESVAEVMQVPLYMLSAGDLGTEPKEVEKTLTTTLAMTTKWKAVLLLDEADVFLLSRNAQDLERNKLVSIFLRMLEYYRGFLILTTNRLRDIDAAFESRIHLNLVYPELDRECRREVWRMFLEGVETKEGDFGEEQLEALAETGLNGRQIKNVVKPAQLLASWKGEVLGFEHVGVVMRLKAANKVVGEGGMGEEVL